MTFQRLALGALCTLFFSSLALAKPIRVAITVDDLPIHADLLNHETRLEITNAFIDVFKKHKIGNAYGFVNSQKVLEHPETKTSLEAWIAAGFPLGNHSFSHMDLTTHSAADFMDDVRKGETLLKELVQDDTYKWFRYPFLHEGDVLEKRDAVRKDLRAHNYQIAQVTIDFEDWAWNNPYVRCKNKEDLEAVRWLENAYIENAIRRLKYAQEAAHKAFGRDINHILLLHIGTFGAKMLDRLLSEYKSRGVIFISLPEAAADPVYLQDPQIANRRGDEFQNQVLKARGIEKPSVPDLPLKNVNELCR